MKTTMVAAVDAAVVVVDALPQIHPSLRMIQGVTVLVLQASLQSQYLRHP